MTFEEAVKWLKEQKGLVDYGEAGINLIIHDGKIAKVEHTLTTKCQGK